MKIGKHLYPAMRNFVYHNISEDALHRTSLLKSLHEDFVLLVIMYSIFVLSKTIILKIQLGLSDLIWVLVSIIVLLSGWLLIRKIKEPQINFIGHALLQIMGLGIPGIYGTFGVILPYYNALYLSGIVLFFIGLTVMCTYYYVHHCLIWDKFANDSKNNPRGVSGISIGVCSITTAVIAACIGIFQTGGYWVAPLTILLAAIFIITMTVPTSTMCVMRLYYYYRYLRKI